MLLDFCDGRLDPAIYCDKVCADGFEVSNLISTDMRTRNKGFISESFINPPVNIRVVFPCNIQIYRIVINPVVGRQKSTGFEIFTCCSSCTPANSKEQNQRGQQQSSTSGSELFLPVGRTLLQEPSVVCFQSVHFRITDQWRPDNIPEAGQYPVVRDLRHAKVGYLNYVHQVTIRINRTVGGSPPCIRRLEIWGKPPSTCPKYLNDKIRQILFPSFCTFQKESCDIDENKSSTGVDCGNHGNYLTEERNHTNNLENGVEIPEEFIDSITCDMMTNPLLLPCGKNIDQSTLEKHVAAEASWGRLPCDPFTGILLDDKNQAVPNSHLKSRIDQFILKHSELLKHLPRTLGDSNKGQGPLSSRLVQPKPSSKINHMASSRTVNVKSHFDSGEKSNQSLKLDNDSLQTQLKRKHAVCSDSDDNMPSCSSDKTSSTQLTGPPNKRVHHESSLQQSLDSALDKMLGNLPTFRKSSLTSKQAQVNESTERSVYQEISSPKSTTKNEGSVLQVENSSSTITNKDQSSVFKSVDVCNETSRTENIIKCVRCGVDDTVAWYKITCGHIYCRNCVRSSVTHSESMECHQCHNICSKTDIVRVYKH